MSYGIKKLADVELLNSTPENANKLVEVDGEVKRVPESETLNAIAELSEKITNISYNDLTDKPFDVIPPVDEVIIDNMSVEITESITPEYYDNGQTVNVPQADLDRFGDVGGFGTFWWDTKKFVVVWDGVEYRDLEDTEYGSDGIDGPDYMGTPVKICHESGRLFIATNETGTHTLSIYRQGEEEIAKTLDLKFLKAEPNKQLETDEYGNAVWEDKMRVKGGPKWEQVFSKEIEFIKSSYVGAPNIGYGGFDNVNNISIIEGDSYRLCGPWGDSEFIATADGVGFSGESGPYVWTDSSKVQAKQPQDSSTEYTKFTLYHLTQTPDTIDPKFLPGGVQWYSVYGNGWENVVPIYRGIYGTSEPDADTVPASEVLEAFKSGAEVRIYYAPSDCYGTMTGFNVNFDNNNAFIGMAVGSSEILPALIGTVTSSDPT